MNRFDWHDTVNDKYRVLVAQRQNDFFVSLSILIFLVERSEMKKNMKESTKKNNGETTEKYERQIFARR